MGERTQVLFDALFMCHKRPDRSFFYKGKQFPICARCTGLGIGYVMSFVVLLIAGLLQFWVVLLLLLPMVIDGTGQLFKLWESTNSRRLVTGILAGIGLFYIIFLIGHHGFMLGQTVGKTWFGSH